MKRFAKGLDEGMKKWNINMMKMLAFYPRELEKVLTSVDNGKFNEFLKENSSVDKWLNPF